MLKRLYGWFFASGIIIILVMAGNVGSMVIKGYFPVYQGAFWNFINTGTGEIITWAVNGSISLKDRGRVFLMVQDAGRVLCMREDWEGLQVYGEFSPAAFFIAEKPLLFLPRDINPNPEGVTEVSAELRVFSQDAGSEDFKETGKEQWQTTFRMEGYEDLKIGSKNFKDCLVIEKITRTTINLIRETIWLAPTIGPVKMIVRKGDQKSEYIISSYSEPGAADRKSFNVKDFFPVRSGISWLYQDRVGATHTLVTKKKEKARLRDVLTVPFEDYQGDILYYAFNDQGLVLHQKYIAAYGGLLAYPVTEQSAVVLPTQLTPGEFYSSRSYPRSYSFRSMTLFEDSHPWINCSSIVLGTEDVAVPLGTYKNCLKLCQFFIIEIPELQFDVAQSGYIWLAKDIGVVKEQTIRVWNSALLEKVSSVFDVRFWHLAGVKGIQNHQADQPPIDSKNKTNAGYETAGFPHAIKNPSAETKDAEIFTKEIEPSGGISKTVTAQALFWEGNSRAMFERAVAMSPTFVRPLAAKKIMGTIAARVDSEGTVTEAIVVECVKKAMPERFIDKTVNEIELLKSK